MPENTVGELQQKLDPVPVVGVSLNLKIQEDRIDKNKPPLKPELLPKFLQRIGVTAQVEAALERGIRSGVIETTKLTGLCKIEWSVTTLQNKVCLMLECGDEPTETPDSRV